MRLFPAGGHRVKIAATTNACRSITDVTRRAAMRRMTAAIICVSCAGANGVAATPARSHQATGTTIEHMPAPLETEFALSAIPAALRQHASVYLLDPGKGYQLSVRGSSGVTCLVERTAWERADFRHDIYVPLCYDAAGTKTFLKVIMDVATLRIQGMSPAALKSEIQNRYKNKTYGVPERTGVSYMVAPVQRTWMLPDGEVHTGTMPHLMFYAPKLTNQHIGAATEAGVAYPFMFEEGIAEQSYIIQVMGEAETARIVADHQKLLGELCTYRDVLCLPEK